MVLEIIVRDVVESKEKKESDFDFRCNEGMVIVGRRHSGDENGPTKYKQGKLECKNKSYNHIFDITLSKDQKEVTVKESNSTVSCPCGYVMVGRRHKGDENKSTTYYFKKIIVRLKTTTNDLNTYLECIYPVTLQESQKASKENKWADYAVDGCHYPMVSRVHHGDENTNTATFFTKILVEVPDENTIK